MENPMDRIDGYLSTKAQGIHPDALVTERTQDNGVVVWLLSRPGQPDVSLGRDFRDAKQALWAMRAADKSRRESANRA